MMSALPISSTYSYLPLALSHLSISNNQTYPSLASQGVAQSKVVPHTSTGPSLLLKLPTTVGAASHVLPAVVSDSQATIPVNYAPLTTEGVIRTYSSYHQQPIPELTQREHGNWILNLSIPVPKDVYNPTLHSLTYIIKYASTFDNGDATVQADVVITPKAFITEGISLEAPAGLYSNTGALGYSPQVVDEAQATCLSSVLGIKSNAGGAQWSHYLDHQHLFPNIRLPGDLAAGGSEAGLYLSFQVCEYPTAQTLRCLAVEVASTWLEDVEARKAAEEAAALEKARQEEEARKAAEQAALEKARKAKDDGNKKKAAARAAAAKATDGSVADAAVQDLIKERMQELNIQPCSSGYGFKRIESERIYRCDGGSHVITFEQLGL
ncbi:hypothetical protein SISSUDRAFT_279996 [Sistotremastrum suecicum HHB10207 ss-3]|uniref:Uncharacterized protein n=1 Tax=Sistotremastrum suecicum HHB10207 ss-3 TaxID=1314776 RepID=A0A166G9E9_9AGAM|nr:hypothetical protein SISSUDRAFT_279996 [Sistotremastrum suecicum HHB10207 ss-3]